MARRHRNHHLRTLLSESGLTGEALSRSVNALGRAEGLSLRYERSSVSKWLAGSRPPAPVPRLVAEALTRRLGRTVAPEDTGLAVTPAPTGVSAPGRGAGEPVAALAALSAADADPARRTTLRRTAYLLASAPPKWPEARPRARRPEGRATWRAGSGEVEALRAMSGTYAHLLDFSGGGRARTALAAFLAHDVSAWLRAGASQKVHRRLLTGAGELAHLQARMCVDNCHHGLAQRYFHLATELAVAAGDRTLYSIVLRTVSSHASQLRLQRPQLAEAALEAAPRGVPPGTRAFLLVQYALAQAERGRARQARYALRDAEEAHRGAAETGHPFAFYPRAGLNYQRAQVFCALGDLPSALTALSDSLRHRPGGARRARALTRIQLAELLLQTGRLTTACTQTQLCLDDFARLHSPCVRLRLTALLRQLTGRGGDPVVDPVLRRAKALLAGRPAAEGD